MALGTLTTIAASEDSVRPLLETYCFDCHGDGSDKAGVALDQWPDDKAMRSDQDLWRRVQRAVFFHDMPPSDKTQPTAEERRRLLQWIDRAVFQVDCASPDPGRVTIRRLNRVEYNHTIRDLLGVDLPLADDFPVDDSGHGFDTIGDALSLPPILLEKYLSWPARAAISSCVASPTKCSPTRWAGARSMPTNAPWMKSARAWNGGATASPNW
jgi:hypothetical protein